MNYRPSVCKSVVGLAGVALVFAVCLFANIPTVIRSRWLGQVVQEIIATFRDPGTQWMVYACLGVYFVTFLVLETRQAGASSVQTFVAADVSPLHLDSPEVRADSRRLLRFRILGNADAWLIVGLVIAALAYAFNYPVASKSTETLTLLAGIVLGKGAVVGAGWGSERAESRKLKAEIDRALVPSAATICRGNEAHFPQSAVGNPPSPISQSLLTSAATKLTKAQAILVTLIFLLLLACLWQPEMGMQYQYRGQDRWSGPWDNPNIFGMLMGVGVVLAVGEFLSLVTRRVSRDPVPGVTCEGLGFTRAKSKVGRGEDGGPDRARHSLRAIPDGYDNI